MTLRLNLGVKMSSTCGMPFPLSERQRKNIFKRYFVLVLNSKTQAAFLFIMHKKNKSVQKNLEWETRENVLKYTNASLLVNVQYALQL